MKKSNALKYIICTFAFVVSFFMLFNSRIEAASVNYEIKNNVFLTLSEEGENYVISSGYHTCGTDSECLETISGDLTIPGNYNGKKIVAIGDSLDLTSAGVLDGLKDIVVGKVTINQNIETIGMKAFYKFGGLKEVYIGENVKLIKDYAFDESGVETIYINRYDSSSENKITLIESSNAFSGTPMLERIVFPTFFIADYYKNHVQEYKELDITVLNMFTHIVTYIYYEIETSCDETVCTSQKYYNGDTITILEDPTRKGFNFLGWYSKTSDKKIETGSVVYTTNPVFEIIAKWELKDAVIDLATYYDGDEIIDHVMPYQGKNKFLEITASVTHELETGYEISYKWIKKGNLIGTELEETSNVHKIQYIGESAVYECQVTITYGSYTKTNSVSIPVSITQRDLIINVNDNTTSYGSYVGPEIVGGKHFTIDSSTSLADTQIIKSYKSEVYNGDGSDLEVGTYTGVLKVSDLVIGYENDEQNIDYVSNYNIIYNYGDLIVEKKIITIQLEKNVTFEYGDDETTKLVLDYVDEDVYGESKILEVRCERENPTNKNAGQYKIIAMSVNDDNYVVSFDENSARKVIISPKSVAVNWTIDENLVYSGEEKSVVAKYIDNEQVEHILGVKIRKDGQLAKFVNHGDYELTAYMEVYNNNYSLIDNVIERRIEKASAEILGPEVQYKIYNGEYQIVDVTLNHEETVIKGFDSVTCNKNVPSITDKSCAFALYTEPTENYDGTNRIIYLNIKPVVLDIVPKVFEVPYGTAIGMSELSEIYPGVNNEEVLVYFTKESTSGPLNVDSYDIISASVAGNNNYIVADNMADGRGTNKVKVVPAEVQVKFYFYENLVYDGKVKNIEIHAINEKNEEVGLQANYNGKSSLIGNNGLYTIDGNAGVYRIGISLSNQNYEIKGKDYLEFSVAKASYDVSKLSLKDKKVKFNFKSHTILLEGELPQGLKANYTINDKAGNGTYLPFEHKVVVTFEGDFDNYNYVEPLEATLFIDITWLFVTGGITISVLIVCVIAFILLTKYQVIKLTDKEQKRRLRRVIRKNKAIIRINEMFKENKKLLEVQEDIVIEEDIKFVKNVVEQTTTSVIPLSFVDQLFKSERSTKEYYSEVKNELLSYEGIVSKIKRDYETFYVNNIPVAKLHVVDGLLNLYLALDPTQYKKEEYKHENVSKKKEFAAVPLKLIVKNIESLRHAKMFVRIIRKREKLKFASNFIRVDYVSVYTAKDNAIRLFKKKRLKKNSKESIED